MIRSDKHLTWLLLIFLGSLGCLSPALFNDWVNWDDGAYVLQNSLIQQLSFSHLGKLFSTLEVAGSYHPLTLLSLALDFQIGGKSPLVYHATNLILHGCNIVLVYLLVYHFHRNTIIAGLTALLFGIHPMHVESVAWVSARKDVLYGFFFLGSLLAYDNYLQKSPAKRIYYLLACLVLFGLSLLSKAAAIMLPVVLFGIDHIRGRKLSSRSILEKIPFLVLSLIFGGVGILAQQAGAAMEEVWATEWTNSIFIGAYGIMLYIVKALVPVHLSAFHPYPFGPSEAWYIYGAMLPVAGLLWLLWARSSPRLVFGLGFFLVTIAPVLQVLPFGRAMIAERYTYIPYIGLFYLAGWGMDHILHKFGERKFRGWVWLLATGYILFLGISTFIRTQVWQNGLTLWTDVIRKYPGHAFGYCNLADYWKQQGNAGKAIEYYNLGINADPGFMDAYLDRGRAFQQQNQPDKALADFSHIIRFGSQKHKAYLNRGMLLFSAYHNPDSALTDLARAIRLRPDYVQAYINSGVIYEKTGRPDQALAIYSRGLDHVPDNPYLYRYRGVVGFSGNDLAAAEADLTMAIRLKEDYGEAWFLRSKLKLEQQEYGQALEDALKARALNYPVSQAYLDNLRARN